jgi:Tfp pilus assembly protein PilF
MTSERMTTNYNAALSASEQGRPEEARRLYLAVLADQPDNVEALNNLGVVAMREGNLKEAVFYFRKILEYRKDYANAYNNLGIVMLRDKENKIAEEYFRKAIEVAPQGVEPYLNLVALMRSERRLEEASKVLDPLLRKGQRDGQVFLSAALIKDELGQNDQAIRYYRAYLQTTTQNQDRRKVVERLSFLEESQSAANR